MQHYVFNQTVPLATHQNLTFSITVPPDRFFNPQLQQLHVSAFDHFKFDWTADNMDDCKQKHIPLQTNFAVILRAKAMKAYQDRNPTPVDPSNAHAEQSRFDQNTARRAEAIPSAREARAAQENLSSIHQRKVRPTRCENARST